MRYVFFFFIKSLALGFLYGMYCMCVSVHFVDTSVVQQNDHVVPSQAVLRF